MNIKEIITYERGVFIVVLLVLVLYLVYTSWRADDLERAIFELEGRVGILEKLRFGK